jgi:hypothetical protein
MVRDSRRERKLDPVVQAYVEAIAELPEETQQDILRQFHERQLKRAGGDMSAALAYFADKKRNEGRV